MTAVADPGARIGARKRASQLNRGGGPISGCDVTLLVLERIWFAAL